MDALIRIEANQNVLNKNNLYQISSNNYDIEIELENKHSK